MPITIKTKRNVYLPRFEFIPTYMDIYHKYKEQVGIGAVITYSYIRTVVGLSGNVFLYTNKRLAEVIGVSYSSIQKYISRLLEVGLLEADK